MAGQAVGQISEGEFTIPQYQSLVLTNGGDGGIRTLDTLNTYDDLANRCLQPLGHVSVAEAFAAI
jgi:hypothetical protein